MGGAVKEEAMKKHIDPILLLLVAAGVGAVLIAWWALMHAWRYL